jgi:histidine decarboxylase
VTQGVSFGYERLKARGYKHILCVYNEVSHYSIPKAFKLAAPDCNTVTVEVNDLNAMKLSKVEEVLRSARTLGVDAILMCCTLGTTFWGGADDIRGLRSLMHENGYSGNSAYIHVDGAFGGGFWRDDKQLPQYQIGKDFDSISVSGHKWYGGFIAGSFLATKKGEAASSGKSVEYVDMVDKFISGSRSGAPAVLWLARFKQFDWPAELQRCYGNRDFLTKELRSLGLKVGGQYINCLMPRPSAETAEKWQLMCVGDEAQVLLLPHVSRSVLEEFLEDIKKDVAAGKMATPTARLQRVNESQI